MDASHGQNVPLVLKGMGKQWVCLFLVNLVKRSGRGKSAPCEKDQATPS